MNREVKLVILDIDGIMTDGKKYYGIDGMPFAKTYCDKDFTAIKRMRASGVSVCFLSGDERVNKAMAKNRNIDFYSARGKNKADVLPEFSKKYNASKEEMVYIGDDLFDIPIMKEVKYSFCPSDSPDAVKNECIVLNREGGQNLVAYLYDWLKHANLISDCTLEDIERLDKNEKF